MFDNQIIINFKHIEGLNLQAAPRNLMELKIGISLINIGKFSASKWAHFSPENIKYEMYKWFKADLKIYLISNVVLMHKYFEFI